MKPHHCAAGLVLAIVVAAISVPAQAQQGGLADRVTALEALVAALQLSPERLAQIRNERLPGSRYASLENCRSEIQAAERMLAASSVPVIDSTRRSVEEIAALIVHSS